MSFLIANPPVCALSTTTANTAATTATTATTATLLYFICVPKYVPYNISIKTLHTLSLNCSHFFMFLQC